MSASSPSGAKPPPRFVPYEDAMREFTILSNALRQLATAMLASATLDAPARATVLALEAIFIAREKAARGDSGE